jgi:hypothetical protein
MTTICHFDIIEKEAKRDLKSGLECIQDRAATILSLVAEVHKLREQRDEARHIALVAEREAIEYRDAYSATKQELYDRAISHEVANSMAHAYLGMMSSTLVALQQPDVDQDAEPPELPRIAEQVRSERDAARAELDEAKKSLADWIRDHEQMNRTLNTALTDRDAARAEVHKISMALGAYPDSDLVSLATTTAQMASQLERVSEERDAALAELKVLRGLLGTYSGEE